MAVLYEVQARQQCDCFLPGADGYDGRCKKCDAVMIKERRKRCISHFVVQIDKAYRLIVNQSQLNAQEQTRTGAERERKSMSELRVGEGCSLLLP